MTRMPKTAQLFDPVTLVQFVLFVQNIYQRHFHNDNDKKY